MATGLGASGRFGRRQLLKGAAGAATLGAIPFSAPRPAEAADPPFDFDSGNGLIQVVIPRAIPAIFGTVSPSGGDASLVLRVTTLITNACFDAIAPYHPTAVGVHSQLGRRPPGERTTRNKNIALIYASFRILNSLLPQHAADWQAMLTSVGLDPNDAHQSTTDPVGIGNLAGMSVAAVREQDGMNQLGDIGVVYPRQPYADTTGYAPVNTAYQLKDPSRWQPAVTSRGNGIFTVQQFVTPQWRDTRPYSYVSPQRYHALPPVKSNPKHPGYKQQVDEVLAVSAGLTEYQKLVAELFNNKILSLGFSALFVAQTRGLGLDEFIHYDFLTNAAAFDTGIAVWKEKYRHDAVRPFSAIRHLYGNSPVTAWGGPGRGTVTDLPANEWQSYLPVADHPEYPSGSASFCAAHAESSRRYFGTDALGWSVPIAAGGSVVEPGVTPTAPLVLGPWDTWTDLERECGLSRLWGGVHFMPSIVAGSILGRKIGARVHAFVQSHLNGVVWDRRQPG